MTIHERKTIRLKEYDLPCEIDLMNAFHQYYYVYVLQFEIADYLTGCILSLGGIFHNNLTQGKICSLGKIVNEEMRLSSIGEIVERCWKDIPGHFPDVELDAFITMPNHLHGIIVINESGRGEVTSPLRKPTLGNIVAYFKYQSTKLINAINRTPGDHFWQRNYFEHIIRDDKNLGNVREYIGNNPFKWLSEKEIPDNLMGTLR